MMKVFLRLSGLALAALALALAADGRAAEPEKAKASQLDKLKRLAGDWTGKAMMHGKDAHDAAVTYRVTSGGSAVVETLFPGTEHEMVTMYHEDGADLVLTHYCMLHNQPRMKAEHDGPANQLVFKFAGGTNLRADKDTHMHDMTLEFLGDDHIKATWTLYKDGKPVNTTSIDLKRRKK
jgi:hypothetical protein